MSDEVYFPELKDPEYNENDRYHEIYVRDSSFEEVGVMAGSKIRIDTRRKSIKGIICVQLGNFQSFLTIAKQHKDGIFSCLFKYQQLYKLFQSFIFLQSSRS